MFSRAAQNDMTTQVHDERPANSASAATYSYGAPSSKPKALDLFCGQGGASMGLFKAGFEVEGVDIRKQPRYPFKFHHADALQFPLEGYDLIWASPPCQFASQVTPKTHRKNHLNLIPAARQRLAASGVPYIIENVTGARWHLRSALKLCGSMFGLKCFRHRWFELSEPIMVLTPPCKHDFRPLLVTTAGNNSRAIRKPGEFKSVKNAPLAYGIDWMNADGLKEAIPPAYSEFLGKQMLSIIQRARQEAA